MESFGKLPLKIGFICARDTGSMATALGHSRFLHVAVTDTHAEGRGGAGWGEGSGRGVTAVAIKARMN